MRCTVFVIIILSVRPSVRLSVCHTRGLCPHGSTYNHDFFTIWWSFWGYHVHPKIRRASPLMRVNEGRVGTNWRFSTNKPPYLRSGARYNKGYYMYWSLMGNWIRAFDWYQNQRPWLTLTWPWTAIMHSVALHTCVSEPTTKICMKIDPYYLQQKCSPGILVSSKVSLCGYSRGFAGEGASNESGVVENGDFRFFRSLCLPDLLI